jgi:hypothetical protein
VSLVEESFSPRQRWKTTIEKRDDGLLQVFLWRWSENTWVMATLGGSITDTVERARVIASVLLRKHGRDEYE